MAKGLHKRASPLAAEEEQRILAEVRAEIEAREGVPVTVDVFWLVGLPEPETSKRLDYAVANDDVRKPEV